MHLLTFSLLLSDYLHVCQRNADLDFQIYLITPTISTKITQQPINQAKAVFEQHPITNLLVF